MMAQHHGHLSLSTCLKLAKCNFESSEGCGGRCSCRKANWNSTENFENVEACQHIFLHSKFSLHIVKINFCVHRNFKFINNSDMKGNSTRHLQCMTSTVHARDRYGS